MNTRIATSDAINEFTGKFPLPGLREARSLPSRCGRRHFGARHEVRHSFRWAHTPGQQDTLSTASQLVPHSKGRREVWDIALYLAAVALPFEAPSFSEVLTHDYSVSSGCTEWKTAVIINSYVRPLHHPASISALRKVAAVRKIRWLAARQIDSSVMEGMMNKIWTSTHSGECEQSILRTGRNPA